MNEVHAEPEVEAAPVFEIDSEDSDDAAVEEDSAPSAEEMAAYLGATQGLDDSANNTDADDKTLPTLADAEALVPAKAKALMDELFRARLEKVKRIDPKEIR